MQSRMLSRAGEEAHPAVEAVGESAVRGCAELEGVHEEAELLLSLFECEAENLEHFGLQFAVVDTDRAAAHFDAVDNHVVGIGAHCRGSVSSIGYVFVLGVGEGGAWP